MLGRLPKGGFPPKQWQPQMYWETARAEDCRRYMQSNSRVLDFTTSDFTACPGHVVPSGMTPATAADKGAVSTSAGRKPSRSCRKRGAGLVEFTLVMPVLLLVATGMVSFGMALHNELVLTNAASIGTQQVAFSRGQTTDPCATGYTAIHNAAPALSSGLSLTFVINGTTYSSTTSCTAGAANMVQGSTIQITASYPYTLAIFRGPMTTKSLVAQVSEYIQ